MSNNQFTEEFRIEAVKQVKAKEKRPGSEPRALGWGGQVSGWFFISAIQC